MLTRGFSQRLNTTMITITGTIEGNLSNTSTLSLLSDTLTHDSRSRLVSTISQILSYISLKAGCTCKNFTAASRNNLCVDMQICTVNCQTYGSFFSNTCTGFACSALTRCFF